MKSLKELQAKRDRLKQLLANAEERVAKAEKNPPGRHCSRCHVFLPHQPQHWHRNDMNFRKVGKKGSLRIVCLPCDTALLIHRMKKLDSRWLYKCNGDKTTWGDVNCGPVLKLVSTTGEKRDMVTIAVDPHGQQWQCFGNGNIGGGYHFKKIVK